MAGKLCSVGWRSDCQGVELIGRGHGLVNCESRAAEYNGDGKFVIFPGYEWSGNTGLGGDRNVMFRDDLVKWLPIVKASGATAN